MWQKIKSTYLPHGLARDEWPRFYLLLILVFLIIEYFGWQHPFHQIFKSTSSYLSASISERHFWAQVWTTLSFLSLLVIVPTLSLTSFLRGGKGFNWMLSTANFKSNVKPYLLAYLVMLVPIVIVATKPSFHRFYPLYRPSGMNDWLLFELIYLPQFFAVEFFFRGPLLSWCERRLGSMQAIFIMLFPYALIHIHKPFAEAVGSIAAGLVLGHLALKGRSIWAGVLLHMMIALTMDVCALYFAGFFSV